MPSNGCATSTRTGRCATRSAPWSTTTRGREAVWLSWYANADVSVLPQVQAIAGKGALVVDASFILAIIAVGVATMVGDSVELRYGIKQLIPRLVVGFVCRRSRCR